MAASEIPDPHETFPVGETAAERQRNNVLLSGYEYEKYATALTGYTGQNLQRVGFVEWRPAIRVRVGGRGNYKAGMARLPDGALVITVCRDNNATVPEEKRFNILVYESRDGGVSWQEIGETPLFGKEPSLAALPDGTLVMIAQGGYFGPGAKLDEHTLARSEDGGRTWDASIYKGDDYPRNLVVEEDGSLLMAHAVKSSWYDPTKGSPNLYVCRSNDAGRSWDRTEGLVDWKWPGFGEVATLRCRDGRLLAALRRQIPDTSGEGFEDTVLTESDDNGKTWSAPRPLLPTAKVHAVLNELADGRLLCTYSNYHVPFGVSAVLSTDGGQTWDLDNTVRLSTSNGYWVGWAVTLQLPNGELVTSYAATTYAEQPPQKVTCEVVRWSLP